MDRKVHIGCACPGHTRHKDGDFVTFRETLPFRAVASIRLEIGQLGQGAHYADVLGMLTEAYLVHGIESWTLVDAEDKPLPVNRETITDNILPRFDIAADLGDVADSLYTEAVVLPLLMRASASSQPSQTDESTSAPEADSTPFSENPTLSKPSSISTTPTAVTGTTSRSRGGGSNSSRSKASAA